MKFARFQSGVALVTVLIMLVIITLLSLSAMRVSTMELNMARNQESVTQAFNGAQALADAIIGTPTSTPVSGGVDYVICTPGGGTGCDAESLQITEPFIASHVTGNVMRASVRRLGPALRPPPRGISSSADKFMAAAFEVNASYDNAAQGQGSSSISEGVLVLVPTN